jgi:hypothetical protein
MLITTHTVVWTTYTISIHSNHNLTHTHTIAPPTHEHSYILAQGALNMKGLFLGSPRNARTLSSTAVDSSFSIRRRPAVALSHIGVVGHWPSGTCEGGGGEGRRRRRSRGRGCERRIGNIDVKEK